MCLQRQTVVYLTRACSPVVLLLAFALALQIMKIVSTLVSKPASFETSWTLYVCTHTNVYSNTHMHTHTLSLFQTHTHTYTRSRALIRTHTCTRTRTPSRTHHFLCAGLETLTKHPARPKLLRQRDLGRGGGGHGEFTTSLIREKQRSDSIVSLESLELLPVFPRRETDSRSCSPRRFSSGLDRVLQFVLQCMLQRVLHVCSSVWEQ